MFNLTEEQIKEIIKDYGGNEQIINTIENELNSLDIIYDEDDYYEVIASIAAQKETNDLDLSRCTSKQERIIVSLKLNKIIINELKRKYNNFEDANPAIQAKFIDYQRRK